ncbi:site-specific tyrosine recombinase XerC [Solimicrobium silvestre]|uniref:Site-specific recombinase XerD n=1 Tax=Solimicrobium silvestre TaxID=2099400 RepID=A0A2S9GS90_9BURK|nr:site-specific tyrosine recombinase XerC [Solimicrobium silvestre]PRC90589.1 Site-specific recombinase XerD [Solimicrobium silvestre]
MALRKKHHGGATSRGWDLPNIPLATALQAFLAWSETGGVSPFTLRQRQRGVRRFIVWAQERGLTSPHEITLPILERYQRHLYHYRKTDGMPLSIASQHTELVPLKAYFKWLARGKQIQYNPAAELEMPKIPRKIPRYVLTVQEVETVLNQTDTQTPMGLRDRAMMEVLYSSGIRRSELAKLDMTDIDTNRGSLLVREGKGKRDRLVPLGARACAWVTRYLLEVRPELCDTAICQSLFLTDYGTQFEVDWLGEHLKRYIQSAGIVAPGACHLFRHACATHMLENGADIRFIQVLLGHASLTSTQIYTSVSIQKLKQIHDATHPARIERLNTTPDSNQ